LNEEWLTEQRQVGKGLCLFCLGKLLPGDDFSNPAAMLLRFASYPAFFAVGAMGLCRIKRKPSSTHLRKRKKVQKWIQRTKINIVLFILVIVFFGETGVKIEIIILDQQVANKFCILV